VILIDSWSQGARYQRQLTWIVTSVWLLVTVPAAAVMGAHMVAHVR